MTDFDKFFGAAYDLVDTIKADDKSFVAVVYDKHAKRLCVMKERDGHLTGVYKILRDIDSPHVPKIYRTFERDGKLVVIEEHIDGQTLDEILTYRPEILSEKFVENIFLQICDALVELHKADIIHRDLTPSNIMLTESHAVKLVDFGIARIFKPDSSTDTEFLGTRGYAAPEQFGVFDLGQTDARTDIFVLGSTVKRLLGKNYDGQLADVLNRCTDLNPANRYQSADEVIRAVKRARKFHTLKRFTLTAAIFVAIFFAVQTIDFSDKQTESPPVADEKIPTLETVADNQTDTPEVPDEKIPATSALSDDTAKSLIDFANKPNSAQIFDVPDVQVVPLPNRPEFKPQPEKKFADSVKLYLYLNGKLTKNNGEHTTAGKVYLSAAECQNWQRDERDYSLFPSNWTARLTVENFTAEDFVNPQIKVSFNANREDTISIDIPTVKAGQTVDVDIPIAGKRAFRENSDECSIWILAVTIGEELGYTLIRELKIKS
ncbi:MAG: serine/threonine protein kinase [Selenomonadaceae bacterium]|nr:serine/threonine protein kinase [Selenomonadaceae bacterium]